MSLQKGNPYKNALPPQYKLELLYVDTDIKMIACFGHNMDAL
jgi:hypothetical protein